MTVMPSLTTERLILRPFQLEDAPRVQDLAGAWEIAATTASIPHPYEDGIAEHWIGTHQKAFEDGESVSFAITRKEDNALVGAIGLHVSKANRLAEMGYWVGVPYWNQGICTEAARAVLKYALGELELNRVQARYMAGNPASGRVMQKIGMRREGTLRQSIYRWDAYHDAELYAVLREDHPVR